MGGIKVAGFDHVIEFWNVLWQRCTFKYLEYPCHVLWITMIRNHTKELWRENKVNLQIENQYWNKFSFIELTPKQTVHIVYLVYQPNSLAVRVFPKYFLTNLSLILSWWKTLATSLSNSIYRYKGHYQLIYRNVNDHEIVHNYSSNLADVACADDMALYTKNTLIISVFRLTYLNFDFAHDLDLGFFSFRHC